MHLIIIHTRAKTEAALLASIANAAAKRKFVTSPSAVKTALISREAEFSTAFEHELAMPHARTADIKKSVIVVARNDQSITWGAAKTPVRYAVALLIAASEMANEEHLATLAAVSGLLLEKLTREVFYHGTQEALELLISNELKRRENEAKVSASGAIIDRYDFVAVTACPTGVAHTNMAAEALEKYAREHNLRVKVERQGAHGLVNELSLVDVAKAERVILAIGKPIEKMMRFDQKLVYRTSVSAPIKDADAVFQAAKQASVYVSSNKGASVSVAATKTATVVKTKSKFGWLKGKNKNVERVSLMGALLNGLSYMIPIVIVGGLFLAIGLGVGRIALGGDVTAQPNTIWYTIFQIGVAGIQLAVVVLGGFIAQAIGGRIALAPALILSFIAQGIGMGDTNWSFFNYASNSFGVSGSNLSFFGALCAGLMCGFAAKYWTQYVTVKLPKALKTIEPIIIVPLLFVLVGWVLFAFAFYVPLYYLSLGLDSGVRALTENNVLWVAGAIGGAMLCFDLGGPVNKIAFGTGVVLIQTQPQVMGAIAAAGSVAPFGMALGWLIGAKLLKLEHLRKDEMLRESFVPALLMGFVGISEGAIPYTIKNPKSAIIANVLGGAVAGAISGAFLITDNAAHTGPIVYILGAVGRDGLTDYVYGLFYIMALIIGVLVTALVFSGLEYLFTFLNARRAVKNSASLATNLVAPGAVNNALKTAKVNSVKAAPVWNGYAWKKREQN